jgi:hypothetical protein
MGLSPALRRSSFGRLGKQRAECFVKLDLLFYFMSSSEGFQHGREG